GSSATGGKGGSSATGGVIGTGGSSTGGAGGHGTGGSATGGSGTGGSGTGGTVATTDENVLERNKNQSRDGFFIQPKITKTMAMAMAVDTNFNTAAAFTSSVSMGSNVAASPVYLDAPSGGGLFFMPTLGGDVIARKEDGTAAWSVSIGAPATGNIGCQSFGGTAGPLGILSTPAIDASTKTIYVAGIVGGASGVTNQIASAIDITTGMVKSGWPVKVDTAASFDPTIHNQRGALSLLNGILYVPYGGFVGDCGTYHGRVVAISTTSPSMTGQWATGDNGGAIWATGGMASDGTSIFAATSNYVPLQTAPPTHTDSEEVVRITGMGTKADYYYPANDWSNYDKTDGDLGATNPVLVTVPGATPSKLVVIIAKGGKGYLLDASSLHGSSTMGGGEKATFTIASGGMSVYGAPAAYQTAMGTYVVMSSSSAAGCPGGGSGKQMVAVKISASPLGAQVAWCAADASPTNPIVTTSDGMNDAVVWFSNNSKLMGVDGDTGATVYTSSTACAGSVPRWSSPIAVKGRIILGGNGHLCAWGVPGTLSQAPTARAKAKRHKRTIAIAALPPRG
ncbi:MAG TPA: hypothetical protein VMT03_06400, partial [Polyangia bacterium]|nr:hypothetical protein [Polyangia bacterium]